ncbi:MAG: tetratricopeptide repeat protein [Patescibacteria group bacterium]
MFILIPIAVAVVALIGAGIIVGKKLTYLRKLNPESHEVGVSLWHDMFPEAINTANKIQVREHWSNWLTELEKALRQTRVWFSKLDRWWAGIINRVRTAREDSMPEDVQTPLADEVTSVPAVEPSVRIVSKKSKLDPQKLKEEEQRLIVEIAQNPKDGLLYETLGDVYVQMGNFNDAIESFKAAISLNPEDQGLKNKLSQVEAVKTK